MQEQNNIQSHPLYSLVYKMVSDTEKTEAYNQVIAEQWLSGGKDYFNGLCPADLYDSGEEGSKEVLEYIEYLNTLSGKEVIYCE